MKFFKFVPVVLLFIYTVVVFRPFFFSGQLPIPADTIVGLYHPFRDLYPSDLPFKNFLITDPVRQQYPWRELAIEQLKKEEWPAWNPYSFAGTPLLANIQTAALYPLNFIYWLLPFATGWSLQVVSQIFLGGVFMWLYLRHLKLHPAAQSLGILSWVGSGFFVAWLEWNTLAQVALWIPLLLLAIDNRWWVIVTLGLTGSFFAGHLQIFFYVLMLTIAYAVAHRRVSPGLGLSLVAATLLTSFQWLPMITLFQQGVRTVAASDWQNVGWFLPWQNLAQFFAPDYFGNPATGNYFGIWNYGEFIGYVGLVPLFFSLFAIHRRHFFWLTILVVSLLFALQNPISEIPFRWQLPLISGTQPTRLLVLVDFSLAMLAAFGLNNYLKTKKPITWWPAGLLTVAIAVLWLIAWKLGLTVSLKNLLLPTGVLLAIVATFRWPTAAVAILLAITLFDVSRFGGKFESFSSPAWLYPETKVTQFLEDQAKTDVFRVAALDDRIFPPNFSIPYRLQIVSGYDSIVLANYAKFVGSGGRITVPKDSDVYKTLNVKYILSFDDLDKKDYQLILQEGQTKVFANLKFIPRVSLTSGQATIEKYSTNEVLIRTQGSSSGTLVLRDTYYPGWQADIDGQNIPIVVAENLFRSVTVPPGQHLVRFKI
ncbi:hypothetical protein HY440_02770 [Candidatus Microgenomates bacterium]|nr:hypothetical protein [Candidatus Microgenomates bacterium]